MLGRKAQEGVDVVIDGSSVSGMHCELNIGVVSPLSHPPAGWDVREFASLLLTPSCSHNTRPGTNSITITDLKSTNGTVVNGRNIGRGGALSPNAVSVSQPIGPVTR